MSVITTAQAGTPATPVFNTSGTIIGLAVASALAFQAFYGTNVAIAGDSIAQQNTTIVSGSYNYNQRGEFVSAFSYLGWPWEFQPDDNFAVFGTTMDVIISTQIPTLLASHTTRRYSRCFCSFGTNDSNAGTSLAQMQAYATTIFTALRNNGIIPVHTGIRPRGNDVATTAAKQKNQSFNEWLYYQSLAGNIEFIDTTATYADNSTAFGNILTTLAYDSVLHPNGRGAILAGRAIADYYVARGIVPQMKFATMQSDIFDRTNNINGVCFNIAGFANPLMQGGTTAPTGMSTSGGTWSKAARALANGQSRSDPSCVMAASTLHYLYDDWAPGAGNWTASQLQSGDILEARAKVTIVSGVNVQYVQIRASIHDGTTATLHYGGFTDSSSIPDGNHTFWLKSPRFTIPPYSGSGNVAMFARAECGTVGGGSGTFAVQGFEIRKVG